MSESVKVWRGGASTDSYGNPIQGTPTVVATLEKDGIADDRLKATGNGPDKPIADNGDSRGRAKNRRVDLVKM